MTTDRFTPRSAPSVRLRRDAAAVAGRQSGRPLPEPNAQPSSVPAPGQSAGMTPAQIAASRCAIRLLQVEKQSALAPMAKSTPAQSRQRRRWPSPDKRRHHLP